MDVPLPVKIRIASDPAKLPEVRAAVRTTAAGVGFSEDAVEQIALAVDEALANVIKHAYGGANDKSIDICIDVVAGEGRRGLRLVIRDFGRTVDPTTICGRDLDDVRPGGLGVHFMRTITDELEYALAEGGGMRLTMLKWNENE